MPDQTAEIDRFNRSVTHHTPTKEKLDTIEEIRAHAREMGYYLITFVDPSRERSLALTHLEETVMWAVKAVILE